MARLARDARAPSSITEERTGRTPTGLFFRNNGLSIALGLLFLFSFIGQWLAGVQFQSEELVRHGQRPITAIGFLSDPQFLSSVFENWESEFLQMGAYVVLTAMLFQRGSAESRDPDHNGTGDLDPKNLPQDAPSALRKGRITRWLYARSLGLMLFAMFVVSFVLHWFFSAKAASEEASLHGRQGEAFFQYVLNPQLWFESFQNWQSEFLSAGVLVVLSIWLRQKGSPESKPLSAPHSQTGS